MHSASFWLSSAQVLHPAPKPGDYSTAMRPSFSIFSMINPIYLLAPTGHKTPMML